MFGSFAFPSVVLPRRSEASPSMAKLDNCGSEAAGAAALALSSEIASTLSSERRAQLQRTVEHEIVPRLLVSHRAGALPPSLASAVARQLTDADVTRFLAAVRGTEDARAEQIIRELIEEGTSLEAVYLDLLAPAARRLGQLWERDECDFIDVTVAMGRMQRSLRDLSAVFIAEGSRATTVGAALLSCIPGEQHTLGIVMVGEFLLRDGWRVMVGAPWSAAELPALIASEWYDVVGFSVGCESRVGALKREMRRVRAASRNPHIRVLVGGQVFIEQPELAQRLGADGFATDARNAPQVARTLLAAARPGTSPDAARAPNSGHGEHGESVPHD
jgi:methanogenic corrinoid protein MtbC1